MNGVGAHLESTLGKNKHSIFMKILQGYLVGREVLVYKILKSLYGLKQAGQLWNKTITKFVRRIGFTPTNTDVCILTIQ